MRCILILNLIDAKNNLDGLNALHSNPEFDKCKK